jgi:hypothetical protein
MELKDYYATLGVERAAYDELGQRYGRGRGREFQPPPARPRNRAGLICLKGRCHATAHSGAVAHRRQ